MSTITHLLTGTGGLVPSDGPPGFPLSYPGFSWPSWQFSARALITLYRSYQPLWYVGTVPDATCLRCWRGSRPFLVPRFPPSPSPLPQSPSWLPTPLAPSGWILWLVVCGPVFAFPCPLPRPHSPRPCGSPALPSLCHLFSLPQHACLCCWGGPPGSALATRPAHSCSSPPWVQPKLRAVIPIIPVLTASPIPASSHVPEIGHQDCDHILPRSLAPPTIRTIGLAVP